MRLQDFEDANMQRLNNLPEQEKKVNKALKEKINDLLKSVNSTQMSDGFGNLYNARVLIGKAEGIFEALTYKNQLSTEEYTRIKEDIKRSEERIRYLIQERRLANGFGWIPYRGVM